MPFASSKKRKSAAQHSPVPFKVQTNFPDCLQSAMSRLPACLMSLLAGLSVCSDANAIGEAYNSVVAHSSQYGLPSGELRAYTGANYLNPQTQNLKTPYLWVAGDDEVVPINGQYKGQAWGGRILVRDQQGNSINTQHFLTYDIDNDGVIEAVASGPQGVYIRDLVAQSLPFTQVVAPYYASNTVRVVPMPRMVAGSINGFLAVENGIIRSYHYLSPGNLITGPQLTSANSNFADIVIPRDPTGNNFFGYGDEFITIDGGDIRILNANTGALSRRANFLLHPGDKFLDITTIDKGLSYFGPLGTNQILASIYNTQTGYGSFVAVDTQNFAAYEWSGTVPDFLPPQGQFQALSHLQVSSLGNSERPVFWSCADKLIGPGAGNSSIVAFPLTPDGTVGNLLSVEGQQSSPFGITGCDTFQVDDVDGDGKDEYVATRNGWLLVGKAGGGFSRQVRGSSTGQLQPLDLAYDYNTQELVIKLSQGTTFNMLNATDDLYLFASTSDAEFTFPAFIAGGGQTLVSGLNPAGLQSFRIHPLPANGNEVRFHLPTLEPAAGNRAAGTVDSSGRLIPAWTTGFLQAWLFRYNPPVGSQPGFVEEAMSNSISLTTVPAME